MRLAINYLVVLSLIRVNGNKCCTTIRRQKGTRFCGNARGMRC